MNFSCILIMRNESKTLPRLVASLAEFKERGGKIVIVDTGSTDNSVKIARELGCEVTEVGDRFRITLDEDLVKKINERFGAEIVKPGETLFDYSQARNYAASLSPTKWCWAIDADEVVMKLDIDKVNELCADPNLSRLEYDFTFAFDQHGNEIVKFMHSKMYRRDKMEWRSVIHECLADLDGGETRGQYVGPDILKLGHHQNQETNRSGYLTGLVYDCYLHPEADRASHYCARELMYRGYFKAAIQEFERHIQMNKWLQERAQSQIFIGDCLLALGDEPGAVSAWEKATVMDNSRREAFLRLAHYYFRKDDRGMTAFWAGESLNIPNGFFYANNQRHYAAEPHELLYWALYLSDKQESFKYLLHALNYEPENPKFQNDLRFYLPSVTIILPQLSREEGLKRALESIDRLKYPKELIQTLVLHGDETVPVKVKKGVEQAQGEYICYFANDCEFTPDALTKAIFDSMNHNKALVSFNTTMGEPRHEGNQIEHFIIRKDFIDQLKNQEIFLTRMTHIGVDQFLQAQAEKLNQFYWSEGAIMNHYHFAKGKSEYDDVYAKVWNSENVAKDRAILQEELTQLYA